MNKAILVGRLTRDPEVRYSQDENPTAVARYTVAVDRRFKREVKQQQILFLVSYSDVLQSSQKSISARECVSLSQDVSRQEAT